jgi:hypothetical protein
MNWSLNTKRARTMTAIPSIRIDSSMCQNVSRNPIKNKENPSHQDRNDTKIHITIRTRTIPQVRYDDIVNSNRFLNVRTFRGILSRTRRILRVKVEKIQRFT